MKTLYFCNDFKYEQFLQSLKMREKAIERLKEMGIRPSEQRIVILEYLLGHRTHPTVEAIYSDLSQKMPTLSKTTVYNTLKLLEENNAILELTIDKHNSHFDGYVDPHSHFMCKKCGKIIDVDQPEATMCCEPYEARFVIQETEIYYRGLCSDCIKDKQ